jgi:hypothetical protein
MPRYFFHVYYAGEDPATDAEGIELAGDEDAWVEATSSCGQMIRDLDGALRADTEWRMDVADGRGVALYRLFFRAERIGAVRRPGRDADQRDVERDDA